MQNTAPKPFHFLNTTETGGCVRSYCLPPLTPRPLSQMAEGSAATKHLMTCDKCGQTAGPGWAPSRPLIGQGGLINNSTVTVQVLLSGRDGAPPAPQPPGRVFMGQASSRRASEAMHSGCAGETGRDLSLKHQSGQRLALLHSLHP